MEGWIKLHRSILESPVFAKPELFKVWSYCLLRASHKERHFEIKTGKGTTVVTLKAGQLIWGRQKGGLDLGMVPKTAERHIKRLGQMNMIKRETFTHYSILTLVKWSDYQDIKKDNVPPMSNESPTNVQPMSNQSPSNVPPMSTYKNVNKEKNEENVKNDNNIENSTPEKKEGLTEQDYFINGIPLYKKANEVFLNYMATNQSDNLNDILKKHEITRDEFENIISKVFESKTAKIWELNDVIKNPYKYVGKAEYWVRNEKTFNPKKKPANKKKTWAENQNDVANIDWSKIYNSNKNT